MSLPSAQLPLPSPIGMVRFVARRIQGLLAAGPGEAPQVDAEAPPLLWLIGASSEDELVLLSALDAEGGSAAGLSPDILEAVLPGGLQILGLFVRDGAAGGAPPALPNNVSQAWRDRLQLVASRAEDGSLASWSLGASDSGKEVGPWNLDASPHWARDCVRGRLTLSVLASSPKDVDQQLAALAAELDVGLRFRFPGSGLVATIDELRRAKPPVAIAGQGSTGAVASVEVLSAGFAAGGPTNFVAMDLKQLPASYDLDFVAYLAPGLPAEAQAASAALALVAAAKRQLSAARALGGERGLSFRCYAPAGLDHAVCLPCSEDVAARARYHQLLRLPKVPLLLPECALPWADEPHSRAGGKLINPHLNCGPKPGWWKGSESTTRSVFIRGMYEYSHYMQDNTDDNGWGCAYRALQTSVSWYRMQYYTEKDIPGIQDIQRLLKRIDEAHKDIVIGSKKWIGTVEGMYLLQDYLGVECKMMYCQDTSDMASQVPQMLNHLATEGTPIMMGAGQYAYTLVGLCFDSASGEAGFMIVDPHYTGKDELKNITQKGWVGWKNLEWFEKVTEGGFINCCLPNAPRGSEHV
mmetsp:Transcript_85699/g.245962  ORF Transcript_85699/g.245962 Transcript_85699/m.245962 type:complete len:581 (-) Transcript_85699:120-1862(-)